MNLLYYYESYFAMWSIYDIFGKLKPETPNFDGIFNR